MAKLPPHRPHVIGYFHLGTLLVREGDRVAPGQPIGYVGDNPDATDPAHLHFEYQRVSRPHYQPINPGDLLDRASHDLNAPLRWPLPRLPNSGLMVAGVKMDGRAPGISSGHHSVNPGRPGHDGADIMYRRQGYDTQSIGDGEGARRWVMPSGITALSMGHGRVVDADDSPTGYRVWIELDGAPTKHGIAGWIAKTAIALGAVLSGGALYYRHAKKQKHTKKRKRT